jgi:hypothetical protein
MGSPHAASHVAADRPAFLGQLSSLYRGRPGPIWGAERLRGSMGLITCGLKGTGITPQDQAADFPTALNSLQACNLALPQELQPIPG